MAPVSSGTDVPMSPSSTRFLIGYLLIATSLTFYLVYSLWSAQPQIAAGRVPMPVCGASAGPMLSNLYPEWVNVGSTASDVLILGCGFTTETHVKFNGAQHSALFVDSSHIRVGLTSAEVAAAGAVVVTLSNGATDFGSGVLTVVPPGVFWHFFRTVHGPIGQEVQLLLIVLFTGAFGSCVYALKSLADYRGDGKLRQPWFTYYLIQPFEGAGVAFLLYLIIRGGFLAGTSIGTGNVNQFGLCGIAGLAGAFSDTALAKLREVFKTLFNPKDDRGDKLTIDIATDQLPAGAINKPYKQVLRAVRGTGSLTWSVAPALPAGLSLEASTGTVAGTPTAVSKNSYEFTVTDSATPAASATKSLTLEITN